ncbi:hypothetical protein PanWU01x14_065510, partial [Parasponia andersonii]
MEFRSRNSTKVPHRGLLELVKSGKLEASDVGGEMRWLGSASSGIVADKSSGK